MNYMFHPLANIFPLIEGHAYNELRADVMKHGVREPIWIYEGQILDGRNRYRAASSQGVEFEVREYLGDDPVGFVVSLNLHRRHLTESQRAAVAAKLANMPAHRPCDKSANLQTSQSDAAKLLNVSTRSVASAKKVIEEAAPELVQAMDEGRASVSAAASLLSLPKEEQAVIATGDKKAIQRASKGAKTRSIELARPDIAEHVLRIINAMDVLARFASSEGLSPNELADRFLEDVDLSQPGIADRLAATLPFMDAIGRIAAELDLEEAA
jgi:hypothetical protein